MNTSPLGWCQKPHYLNHFICDDIVIVKPLLFINVIIYINENSVNILNAGSMATNNAVPIIAILSQCYGFYRIWSVLDCFLRIFTPLLFLGMPFEWNIWFVLCIYLEYLLPKQQAMGKNVNPIITNILTSERLSICLCVDSDNSGQMTIELYLSL